MKESWNQPWVVVISHLSQDCRDIPDFIHPEFANGLSLGFRHAQSCEIIVMRYFIIDWTLDFRNYIHCYPFIIYRRHSRSFNTQWFIHNWSSKVVVCTLKSHGYSKLLTNIAITGLKCQPRRPVSTKKPSRRAAWDGPEGTMGNINQMGKGSDYCLIMPSIFTEEHGITIHK